MAAHLVNRDFKTQRMLSNEDSVLMLTGITKQVHKDPQSHWSPSAFVAVVEGFWFLGRGAGAAWVVMGRGQELPLAACLELSGTGNAPGRAVLGENGLNTQACPSPRQGWSIRICSLCARQHSDRKRYSPSSMDALFYQGARLLNASKNLSLTTIYSQMCISGHLCGFKWVYYFWKAGFCMIFRMDLFH